MVNAGTAICILLSFQLLILCYRERYSVRSLSLINHCRFYQQWGSTITGNCYSSCHCFPLSFLTKQRRFRRCCYHRMMDRNSCDTRMTATTTATEETATTSSNHMTIDDNTVYPILYHKSPLFELYESNLLHATKSVCTTTTSKDSVDEQQQQQLHTALIILNAPIHNPMSPLFQQLWNSSSYRVCADGGANRLYTTVVQKQQQQQLQQVQQLQQEDNSFRSTNSSTRNSSTITATTTAAAAATVINTTGLYIPDCITGDLDSLLPETRDYYSNQGVTIIQISDQDTNDLDKAIHTVMDHFHHVQKQQQNGSSDENNTPSLSSSSSPSPTALNTTTTTTTTIRCIVYGAFGGRFDQEMASFQSLYRYNGTDIKLYLYDDHTMAFLLPAFYNNHIHLLLPISTSSSHDGATNNSNNSSSTTTDDDNHIVFEGPTCGLIPLGCCVDSVTTTGLQWNLNNQSTSFGNLVSTSNRIVVSSSDTTTTIPVTVTCSHPIVFTAQVHAGITTPWSEQ